MSISLVQRLPWLAKNEWRYRMEKMTDAERIAELEQEVAKLKQDIIVAAMWCPDDKCEFKKFANVGPQTLDEGLALTEKFCEGY